MSTKKQYPSHTAPRVFVAEYRDKRGQVIRSCRACTLMASVRRIPIQLSRYKEAAEVVVFHNDDRDGHPEAFAVVERKKGRWGGMTMHVDIQRASLPLFDVPPRT